MNEQERKQVMDAFDAFLRSLHGTVCVSNGTENWIVHKELYQKVIGEGYDKFKNKVSEIQNYTGAKQ